MEGSCIYKREVNMVGSRYIYMINALNELYKRIGVSVTEVYAYDPRQYVGEKLQNRALLIVDSDSIVCQFKGVKQRLEFAFYSDRQKIVIDKARRACWRKYFKYKEEIKNGNFTTHTNDYQLSVDRNELRKSYGLFNNQINKQEN